MEIKKELIKREIAGEYFLVPVAQSVCDFSGLFGLNEVGSFIWDILPRAQSLQEILQAVLEEFDTDEATASADLERFLTRLESFGII
jgi:hypothetical protein